MSDVIEVQWWGVLDFNGWADRPDGDAQSVASRTDRVRHACEQAPGFEAWSEPGCLTVRWWAADDLNVALAKLFTVTGADPADFQPKNRPERVPA
jgi:hypothetical protein